MTDKIRNLLKDVGTVYQGKGMFVYPNSFDELRTEIMKLDNINRLQSERITKAKEIIKKFLLWENDWHNKTESKYELLKQAEQFLEETDEWKI